MNPSEPKSFGPPRGMRDFYPEDMAVRDRLFDAWKTASLRFGFVPYDSCVVETLELLKRKSGEEIVEQIYAFTDKSGRELALRPEMTPSLARMIAARQGSLAFPLKWFTIAQCFRYERMSKGRKREHYQWNLDIVGEESVSAEAEVIACAVHALADLGLRKDDYRVHYNSRALLADLLAKLGIKQEAHAAVFLALDKRGKTDAEETGVGLAKAGLDTPGIKAVLKMMDISSLDDAAAVFGSPPPSLSHLRQFRDMLEAYGIHDAVGFDISVVRGLTYYTGIVFEAFDIGRSFRAIFGGGRYDNLLSDVGGSPATGVGLGFGDVVVAEILEAKARLPSGAPAADLAVGYMAGDQQAAAAVIATAFRKKGRSVDLALRSEKAKNFFSRAGKGQFREAIYLGPDDVSAGTCRIKNLATRTEQTAKIQELTGLSLPSPSAPTP